MIINAGYTLLVSKNSRKDYAIRKYQLDWFKE
jgi:hypothetical protein